jgi:hypothetical protein
MSGKYTSGRHAIDRSPLRSAIGYEILARPDEAETEEYYLDANTDVTDFIAWIETLPAGRCPAESLGRDFQTIDGRMLAEKLWDTLHAVPPTDRGVEMTAAGIGETCDGLDEGTLFRTASQPFFRLHRGGLASRGRRSLEAKSPPFSSSPRRCFDSSNLRTLQDEPTGSTRPDW